MYPDEQTQPLPGEGLNKAAEVTMMDIYPAGFNPATDTMSEMQIIDFSKRLQKAAVK